MPATVSGRVSTAAGWNLGFNVLSKSQTLALLVAGSLIGNLGGVGVIVTAMAACLLGQALADLGLAAELTRLSVAHPDRGTIGKCTRALALQVPLALVLAPVVYLVLGPTSPSLPFMVALGVLSSALVGTIGLTAILYGLGDFRSTAIWLGSGRFLASIAAVTAAAIYSTPTLVIFGLAAGECFGLAGLIGSVRRARARLPDVHHPEGRVHRAHVWIGVAGMLNLLTNQGDTILVASILSAHDLGLYATASALENGVATFSLALVTPLALRSVGTTLRGDPGAGSQLVKKAWAIGAGTAALFAILTWVGAQFAGGAFTSMSGLATGTGPIVLALYLAAAPLSVMANVCFTVGIGFARHRRAGTCQMQAGVVAVGGIVVGAQLAGAVGAAAGAALRDGLRLFLARGLVAPPESTTPSQPPDAVLAGI